MGGRADTTATPPGRALGLLIDFGRLDRCMRDNSLTADNQATILGTP